MFDPITQTMPFGLADASIGTLLLVAFLGVIFLTVAPAAIGFLVSGGSVPVAARGLQRGGYAVLMAISVIGLPAAPFVWMWAVGMAVAEGFTAHSRATPGS